MNVRSVQNIRNIQVVYNSRMAFEIPVTQARAELAELVNRVVYTDERVVLTRHGKPLVALVPAEDVQSPQDESDQEQSDEDAAVTPLRLSSPAEPDSPQRPASAGMQPAARQQPPPPQ